MAVSVTTITVSTAVSIAVSTSVPGIGFWGGISGSLAKVMAIVSTSVSKTITAIPVSTISSITVSASVPGISFWCGIGFSYSGGFCFWFSIGRSLATVVSTTVSKTVTTISTISIVGLRSSDGCAKKDKGKYTLHCWFCFEEL